MRDDSIDIMCLTDIVADLEMTFVAIPQMTRDGPATKWLLEWSNQDNKDKGDGKGEKKRKKGGY